MKTKTNLIKTVRVMKALIESAEILLENLDDANEDRDADGKVFKDIRELRKNIEKAKGAI